MPIRRRCGFPALIAVFVTSLAACGGDGSVTPSGTPASIAIAAGNQQQAAAGGAVTVAPAVLVRDAEQQPVSGVTVQFAVTAGGGALQGSSPVTDASGVARVGSWTLGTSGEQRLTATVGNLPPATFHATIGTTTGTIETSIGTGGGSLEIPTPGHPYRGLKLTIPSATFSGTAALVLAVAQNPSLPTLPSGFRVSGPVLAITSSQLRGSKLMMLQVPISHATNEHVMLAFHDPVRNVTEIMPTVYRDDTLIVVATSHLRPDLLAGPGMSDAGATLRGSDPVGWLMPIAYPLPMQAVGPVLTSFAERWRVLDYGSAMQPGGFGPAIPIMQSLASALDRSLGQLETALQTPGFYADPAQLAAIVRIHEQANSTVSAMLAQFVATRNAIITNMGHLRAPNETGSMLAMFGKIEIDELANQAIVATLSISRKPLPVALLRDVLGEPAVFATAVAGADRSVSMIMPSAQDIATMARQLGQGFQSIPVVPVGGQPAVPVGQIIPLSSFLVDFQSATGTLLNLLQASGMQRGSPARDAANEQMVAAAGLPSVSVETEAALGTGWVSMLPNLVIARSRSIRFRVPGLLGSSGFVIDLPITGARVAQVQGTDLALADVPELANAANLVPTDVVVSPVGLFAGTLRQLTARVVRVIKAPFEVTPVTSTIATQFTNLSFTASVPMPPASGYSIEWAWGDGNFNEYANTLTASHQFTVVKDYKVIARLLSSPGRVLLAADTVEVQVNQAAHWQLVAIEDQDDFFDEGDPVDGENPISVPLMRALAVPASALISVTPLSINSSELQFRVLTTSIWDPAQCCPPPPFQGTERDIPLGRKPTDNYAVGPYFSGWNTGYWSESTGDLGAGTMSGQHLFGTRTYTIKDQGSQVGPAGGVRITGTRNGKTMTGTITLWIWVMNEDSEIEDPPRQFRFTFVATRLR